MVATPSRTAARAYAFPSVIEHEEEHSWSVVFPDLPGCVTWGETHEDALVNAAEVATLHLRGLREKCSPIPKPSAALAGQEIVLVHV